MTDRIVGPDADTFWVTSDFMQDGNLIVIGEGVVIVDNACLTLYGSLWQQDNSVFVIRNNGYLHVMQQYCSQYPQQLNDNSRFEATDATIYANTVYRTFLYGNSTYIARRTYFPFWNFRECFDNSTLIMQDANMVGDLLIRDSCEVHFIRCDTILPWFCAENNDIIDIEFPSYGTVDNFVFDTNLVGVNNIKYIATFDSCNMVLWGIDVMPGCSVVVHNSVFAVALRIQGTDTLHFSNISNRTIYPNLVLPFTDRYFRLSNSYVQIWCVYTYDSSVLYMDSCFWGEAHAKENSMIYAVNCSTNGFPSSVTSTESGTFVFENGKVTAFVSSWGSATTILKNTQVTPSRPGIAQRSNIAHGHSRLLCVNCDFDSLPFAMDTALVMWGAIDSFAYDGGLNVTIWGDAWTDFGPYSSDGFDKYILSWTWDIWDGYWMDSIIVYHEVQDDTLASFIFDDADVPLFVRLSIYTVQNETLSHMDTLWLGGIEETKIMKTIKNISAYPNPFNSSCEISVLGSGFSVLGTGEHRTPSTENRIEIFDLNGKCVRAGLAPVPTGRDDRKSRPYIWQPDESISSGVYLIRATIGEQTTTRRIIYLK